MKKLIFSILLLVHSLGISAQFFFLKKDKSQQIKIENDSMVTYITINQKGDTSEIDSYLNNHRHGYSMQLNLNGEKEIEHYRNGKKNGIQRVYYQNGNVKSETNYVNGVKEGQSTWFYKDGTKHYEGYFKNGVETGRVTFYYPNGIVEGIRFWNDSIEGKLDKHLRYYKDGNLKEILNFSSLIFEGEMHIKVLDGKQEYFSNEGHQTITEFHKGFATGFSSYSSPKGKFIWQSRMVNDSTKRYYYYNEEGELTDSSTQRFWKPFKNPLIRSDSFHYNISDGRFSYLSNKKKYANNAIREQYNYLGNLESREQNGFYREYYPNGKLRVLAEGSTNNYYFIWKKQFLYSDNKLVKESYLKDFNRNGRLNIKTEYKENKDTLKTINILSAKGNQSVIEVSYLNGNHVFTTMTYLKQTIKLESKSANKIAGTLNTRRYYKNFLRRLFKENRKKRFTFKVEDNSFPKPENLLEDGNHIVTDLNGRTFLTFTIKDSVIVENINFNLPNNKTVFKYLETDGSHSSADYYTELGFQVDEMDSIQIYESIFPRKDTLTCSYLLNGEQVYFKFYDEYVIKNPKTNEKFAIELYENGKVKERINQSNNNTILYYKNGNIRWETCYERDSNNYNFTTYYYKNGNPKLKHEQNNNPKLYQRIIFRRNGSLHMVYTDSSTVLYNRKGDLIALARKTSSITKEVVFVRNDNQKKIIYNNGRRQYKSITFIKMLPKMSSHWLKKSARKTYSFVKKYSNKSYRYSKSKVSKIFDKKNQDNN